MSSWMRVALIGAGGLLVLSLGHFIYRYVMVVGETYPFILLGP